jgi:hypothetical protein
MRIRGDVASPYSGMFRLDCLFLRGLRVSQEAGLLLYELWCQWDFTSDCPLPDGVERVWNAESNTEELLWKKTGDPYSPSAPVTPPVSGLTRTLTQLRVTRAPRQTTNFTV